MQRRISPFLGCERPVQHLGMHPQIVTLCAFDDTFGIEENPANYIKLLEVRTITRHVIQ